jgi:hypothetical protein
MIELLPDLPESVVGFRFSGPVTREEYVDVLRPPLEERLSRGERIRLLVVIDEDFGWFKPGAFWEDLKFGAGTGVPHHAAWERSAIASDADWVRHAMAVFGWMVPGEARAFPLAELDDAKAWLAA